MQVVRLWPILGLLGFLLSGCVPPPVDLTPEQAVSACEAPTTQALRVKDAKFASLVLEPAATSRIQRGPLQVGRQPLGMVVAGSGTARETPDTTADVSYVCLIAPSGEVLFVDVSVQSTTNILAECAQTSDGTSRLACLSDLLRAAERGLAEAEAKAVIRARSTGPKSKRAEVEEPAATSIGAWRVYRDAECDRQRDVDPDRSTDLYQACRVGLTRQRVRQLGL